MTFTAGCQTGTVTLALATARGMPGWHGPCHFPFIGSSVLSSYTETSLFNPPPHTYTTTIYMFLNPCHFVIEHLAPHMHTHRHT